MNIGHLIILVLTGLFFLSFFRKHLWRLNTTEAATRNSSGDILKQQRRKFQTAAPRFKTKAPRFKTTAPQIRNNSGEARKWKVQKTTADSKEKNEMDSGENHSGQSKTLQWTVEKIAVDSQENLSGQSRKQWWTVKKSAVDSQEKSCGESLKDTVAMINTAVA